MKRIIINDADTGVCLAKYPSVMPSEKDIAAFESELGFSLPDDYRSFLFSYNGGTCDFKNIIEPIDGYLADLYGFRKTNEKGCMPLRLPKECRKNGRGCLTIYFQLVK